jgi:hypothetical protein
MANDDQHATVSLVPPIGDPLEIERVGQRAKRRWQKGALWTPRRSLVDGANTLEESANLADAMA